MRDATDVVTVTITTITMTTMMKSTSVADVVVKKITMIMTTRGDSVDGIEMRTIKTWISTAPRTEDVSVTMMLTNPSWSVESVDVECDGKGSVLFQQ